MALTSMSEDKLKSQLKKLSHLGYINYMVPGASGKHLFGVVNSCYSLNLLSDLYSSEMSRLNAIFFVAKTQKNIYTINTLNWLMDFITIHCECFTYMDYIGKKSHSKSSYNQNCRNLKKHISRNRHLIIEIEIAKNLLAFSFETKIIETLTLKVLNISSYLLSEHYDEIDDDFTSFEITEKTKTEFFSKKLLRSLNVDGSLKGVISESLTNQLLELIHNIALKFSLMLKDSFKPIKNVDLAKCYFHIHPENKNNGAFVIYVSAEKSEFANKYACLKKAYKLGIEDDHHRTIGYLSTEEIDGKLIIPNDIEWLDKLEFNLSDFFPISKAKAPDFSWKDETITELTQE